MQNKNLKSPNKKHEISFGEMWEQAMGGAYCCPIYLKNENDEPFLLHERSVGHAIWQGNSKLYFPIWVRNSEGYLKQKIAFFDVKRSKIGIFERFFEVIELKSIKGDLIQAIDSPNWHPNNIEIDIKNEPIAETYSWTKMDAEIVAMKRRYEATSIAPWVTFVEGRDFELGGSSFIMTGIPKGGNIWGENRGEDIYISGGTIADQDFIAHARQDIPTLIAEIERLKLMINDKR
jgi:hypothetical protein